MQTCLVLLTLTFYQKTIFIHIDHFINVDITTDRREVLAISDLESCKFTTS